MAGPPGDGVERQRELLATAQQTVSCPGPDGRDFAGRFSSSFRLALSNAYDMRDQTAIRVSARLERPTAEGPPEAACDGPTSRAVEVQSTIHPETGKPITVTGDAGFSVTLTLR